MFYDQWTKYEEYLSLNFKSPDGMVKSKAFYNVGINVEIFVYRSGTQCQNSSLKRN